MLERRDEYENNIFLQLQPERYVEGVAEEIYYKSSIFCSLWVGGYKVRTGNEG